jgi:hypothetical protein
VIEDSDALLVLQALTEDAPPPVAEAKSELKTYASGLGGVGELRGLVLCMIWAPSMAAAAKGVEEKWVVEIHKSLIAASEQVLPAESRADEAEEASE